MKILLILFAISTSISCQHREFTWASDLADNSDESHATVILPGDEIELKIWKHDELNTKDTVDKDGTISIMFIGPVKLAGHTESEAETVVKQKISNFIVDPNLSLKISKSRQTFASAIGEVKAPGRYPINKNETVFHLLARAGGLTEYADPDSIYIIRRKNKFHRIRFKFSDLSSGKDTSVFFPIEDGDILYAE